MDKENTKAPAEQTEEVKEAAETKETPKEEELEAENPLKEELEKLKKEKAELNDHYIRMLAEYENFRKRSQREKDGIYGDAVSDTVAKLLPILDSFDRAAFLNEISAGIYLTSPCVKHRTDKRSPVCRFSHGKRLKT